jgi:predicted  nucleic acid-binding Zn-ribbon protein
VSAPKFLQFNHVRQQQIDSLKKAISHHKLACEEAQRRYDRLKLKVRDLSDAVQKIDIRISLGETQDRIALKRQRDQIQAQIAKLADRKLENELNPRREILKKGKQALDWMVDLEIDDDR